MNETKTIRISKRAHQVARTISFKKDKTIKQLVEELIEGAEK